MSTETVPQISAEFVADARRHYVPAIRWARANGWNAHHLKDGADIAIHLDVVWHGVMYATSMVVHHVATGAREPYYPTSVKQAIDFLVTAEVLPVELASWNQPSPGAYACEADETNCVAPGRFQVVTTFTGGAELSHATCLHHGLDEVTKTPFVTCRQLIDLQPSGDVNVVCTAEPLEAVA